MLHSGEHVALQVSRFFDRVKATFNEYKRQKIVSLFHDRREAPTITRILTQKMYFIITHISVE